MDRTPVHRLLGLCLLDRQPGRAEVELAARAELAQEEGVVHGGVLAALLDTAAVYAVHPDLPTDRTMTSISFQIHFLAPADPQGAPLRAVGTVLRQGNRVLLCEAEARQGATLVAKGSFTYLLRERPDG
jgi:uncharacterized protein (TIGR00369 family)